MEVSGIYTHTVMTVRQTHIQAHTYTCKVGMMYELHSAEVWVCLPVLSFTKTQDPVHEERELCACVYNACVHIRGNQMGA